MVDDYMNKELDIKIEFRLNESRSVALDNNKIIGECEFDVCDNKWIITHTGVREEYNGHGIARRLVESVAINAIENNITLVPLCSYAKKVLEG